MQDSALLTVKGLTVGPSRGKPLLEDLAFTVHEGQNLGILGESGSGKSLTVMALLRLLPTPGLSVRKGEITFAGLDLRAASEAEMNRLRGSSLAAIFQDPLASLNPVRTLGYQMREVFDLHPDAASMRDARIAHVLAEVGLGDGRILRQYPHQLSGGMRQRFLIALALALKPRLLLADEPSSALDVTLQAQILRLLKKLQGEAAMSILCVSHDLGLLSELCERCLVLYRGHIVEMGTTDELIARPLHPYTRALVASLPLGGRRVTLDSKPRPALASGLAEGSACSYAPRCPHAVALCRSEAPPSRELGSNRSVSCHRAEELCQDLK